ncbi:hypothetical protein [Afipia birgiae]|jgi:hypothetical protein|uniref:hypothetical protein n=1 Tax=Afipia birgiae TaxID=151414 RepID=UPI001564BF79|nr:hypothetical protein [Afipia birgiae]
MFSAIEFVSLLHADKCAPHSGQSGAYQNVNRVPAERVAVGAHLRAKLAELALIGGIEEPGQHDQETGDKVHFRCPLSLQEPHLDAALFLLRFSLARRETTATLG